MGTKKSHRAAENVQFVRNFIKGKVDRELYKHMLLSLWHTYTALEDELRKNEDNPM
jgi:heme oxygenase